MSQQTNDDLLDMVFAAPIYLSPVKSDLQPEHATTDKAQQEANSLQTFQQHHAEEEMFDGNASSISGEWRDITAAAAAASIPDTEEPAHEHKHLLTVPRLPQHDMLINELMQRTELNLEEQANKDEDDDDNNVAQEMHKQAYQEDELDDEVTESPVKCPQSEHVVEEEISLYARSDLTSEEPYNENQYTNEFHYMDQDDAVGKLVRSSEIGDEAEHDTEPFGFKDYVDVEINSNVTPKIKERSRLASDLSAGDGEYKRSDTLTKDALKEDETLNINELHLPDSHDLQHRQIYVKTDDLQTTPTSVVESDSIISTICDVKEAPGVRNLTSIFERPQDQVKNYALKMIANKNQLNAIEEQKIAKAKQAETKITDTANNYDSNDQQIMRSLSDVHHQLLPVNAEDKFQSVRVVKNVRQFVQLWGQKYASMENKPPVVRKRATRVAEAFKQRYKLKQLNEEDQMTDIIEHTEKAVSPTADAYSMHAMMHSDSGNYQAETVKMQNSEDIFIDGISVAERKKAFEAVKIK